MQIYLIRHGESTANKEKAFQGWNNVHLSIKGKNQAKKLSEYFLGENVQFKQIYSSPLVRALETANPLKICSSDSAIIQEDGFKSINVGEWGGLEISTVKARFQHEYEKWRSSPTEFRFPKGESLTEVYSRSWASLLRILNNSHFFETKIAIISHMITIKVLVLSMLGKNLTNIWEKEYTVPNTGMMIFNVVHEGPNIFNFHRIELSNPTPHLALMT